MKAKEYAELYYKIAQEQSEREATLKVFELLLGEFKTITEQRRAHSDGACLAIVRELDQKWRALCRLVPDFKPDGYASFIREHMPQVWEAWEREDRSRRF